MESSRRSQRGFTLVELLVVIGILGVLAAVVLVAVQGFSGQADAAACKTDERSVVDAEEVHRAETGSYADEAGLVAAGRLRHESSLHDVVLTTGDYELVAVGSCATDQEVAAGGAEAMDAADQAALEAKAAEAKAAQAAVAEATAEKDGTTIDGFGDGWIALGTAELSDSAAQLTSEKDGATGSVFFTAPVTTDGLHVTFAARSGKGGEGLAFVLMDPEAGAKSLGQGGAGLGFAGLPGYGITFDTVQSTKGEPSEPFVGLAQSSDGLAYLDTSTAIPNLVDEWHEVTVDVHGSTLVVAVDGKTLFKQKVKLPPTVLIGFTGANGDSPARQEVAKVQVGSS